jgi:urease accessory protein
VLELWLVTAAASLLEGDELSIDVAVGEHCRLIVRSIAAQLVHPAPSGHWSAFNVRATVHRGGRLTWKPEPVIVSGGARYRSDVSLALDAGARCTWFDELLLGRHADEVESCTFDTSFRADFDGRPLVRDGLSSTPGWQGPAVLRSSRYIGTEHELGIRFPALEGWFALAGPGRTKRVLADDVVIGRRELGTGC